MTPEDRRLGMNRPITRRQFIEGAAVAVASVAGGALLAACSSDDGSATTTGSSTGAAPATATGMRGQTDDAYRVMHAIRDGAFDRDKGAADTGETYDLVVIGAGISGLAAAHLYRKNVKSDATVLLIDTADEPGGHARRNEFDVNGTRLIGYGGTESIEAPALYSDVAAGVLNDIGIDTSRFENDGWYDTGFAKRHGLADHTLFDRETFGRDVLVATEDDAFASKAPLSARGRRDLGRLMAGPADPWPNQTPDQKARRLGRTSYADYLTKDLRLHEDVVKVFQQDTHAYYGLGIDAVTALDCVAMELPGFEKLGLGDRSRPLMSKAARLSMDSDQDYIYHYPDGNATVVRALIHRLIPEAMPGDTVEQQVVAQMNPGALDREASPVRIRLRSTVVKVAHDGAPADAQRVNVVYENGGSLHRVTASHVVAASWHVVSARIIDGLPEPQVAALKDQVKVPLVYANVALTNWRAFKKLGIHGVQVAGPGPQWHWFALDYPVSVGDYRFSQSPDEPVVVHVEMTPNAPGSDARTQMRAGRGILYNMTFEQMERSLRDLLDRVLGPGGFDPAEDIAAITINRWGHGYAYEYTGFDRFWPGGDLPITRARRPHGRVTFANSDSGAFAYTNGAIDEAHRAVSQLPR